MDGFNRQTAQTQTRQFVRAGEHALANFIHAQLAQWRDVLRQVPNNQFVFIHRVNRQWIHNRQKPPLCAKHPRHMNQWLGRGSSRVWPADGFLHHIFITQVQTKFKQPWLRHFNQFRQRNGCLHIRKCIMRGIVRQTVRCGEFFQTQTDLARFILRKNHALRTQRIHATHHINDVPARATIAELALIRWDEVAPKHKARDLIVKTQGVVAHANGMGHRQFAMNMTGKLRFGHAVCRAQLQCNPCN